MKRRNGGEDHHAAASAPRSAAERMLNPDGGNRRSRLRKQQGPEQIAQKIGAAGVSDLEAPGTLSSFARDAAYNLLAEKTHAEIFKTEKDAVKKQINYSNYSLHPSNLISNRPLDGDGIMEEYINDKIMDYKTPYVRDLRSSIRNHNAQMKEAFKIKKGRFSVSNRSAVDGSLAMSNLKDGTSHVPVAPSNPNKPLFHG